MAGGRGRGVGFGGDWRSFGDLGGDLGDWRRRFDGSWSRRLLPGRGLSLGSDHEGGRSVLELRVILQFVHFLLRRSERVATAVDSTVVVRRHLEKESFAEVVGREQPAASSFGVFLFVSPSTLNHSNGISLPPGEG